MRRGLRRAAAVVLGCSLLIGCTGCEKEKKEPKPAPKATAVVNEGNTNASGTGEGQADVPLVIACGKFSSQFNPFTASGEADRQVMKLTQIPLVTNDRSGRLIYSGIDGEIREYGGREYTYYGATDLEIKYNDKRDTTIYRIKLRDDLTFSDGGKLTIDDVIFSLYVFCDNDYDGDVNLKNMPIKGLLNYQANSTKAEKVSKKEVAKFIKKNPGVLKKWVQKNITEKGITGKEARRRIERQTRLLLAKKKGKSVKNISGIRRINDYELTITTVGYDRAMSGALQIPICALHYYGDESKYNVEKNKFGFRRGDISAMIANKTTPVGAGAYRFVKLEDNVAYFNSNELYFLGCPQIAYLQLKDMTDILVEEREQLEEKISAQSSFEPSAGETPSAEEINPLIEAVEVTEGVVDVISGDFGRDDLPSIANVNSNKKLSGSTVDTRMVSDGDYWYIGINGDNVSVLGDAGSEASVNLRKAFAVVFSVSRGTLKDKDGDLVNIVNYPVAEELWLSPSPEEENYAVAYLEDVGGNEIFEEDDSGARAKSELVSGMALEHLRAAGYRIQEGKAVEAPEGASLQYSMWIADGEDNPLYPAAVQAEEMLEAIGITLKLQTVDGEELLQEKLAAGNQQIWVGSRPIEDMDLETRYGISQEKNIFGISDKNLGKMIDSLDEIMSAQNRREKYQSCFETVLGWAVEVPVCEYSRLTMFSSKRIDMGTVPEDCTPYYSWTNEIQKVKMR